MSEKKRIPFSKKHDPDVRPDPLIEKEMRKRGANQEISCALAFEIAGGLGVGPEAVGLSADVLDIRLVKCQLGLFGHKPGNKIVTAENASNQEVTDAVNGASENHRLSCETAWRIAARFDLSKLTVSNVCQANGIQIKNCRLGAF